MMIQLYFEQTTMYEKRFADDLIQYSIFDIVKTEETSKIINDSVFKSEYDFCMIYENEMIFLLHIYNEKCLIQNPVGTFRCQKIDNGIVSNDNKKHQFLPLPNDYLVTCIKIIQCIGLK